MHSIMIGGIIIFNIGIMLYLCSMVVRTITYKCYDCEVHIILILDRTILCSQKGIITDMIEGIINLNINDSYRL